MDLARLRGYASESGPGFCVVLCGTSDGRYAINISDVLLAYAQLALGLAGFSALLVALSGSPHQWSAVDAFRIKNMLAFSFAGIFLGLIPVLLEFFQVAQAETWRISLLVLAGATFGGGCFALVGIRKLTRQERLVLNRSLTVIVLSVLAAVSVAEIAVAFMSERIAPGVFFAGLLLMLAMSVYLVLRFLFARPAG
ncbi:MAG: hypothetical protein WCD66_11170 [Rhodanobacteraceae bacterium]